MIAQLDTDYLRRCTPSVASRLLSYALFEGRPLTTRGRWINPLVSAQARLGARLGPEAGPDRPIFIVGLGRSGTTVLGVVLSAHRDVGFLNEPKLMWSLVHPEEDVIGSYRREAARYRLHASDLDAESARRARKMFAAYLRLVGRSRLVDKYPELVFRIPFAREVFPDACFLGVLRDGRDAIRSIDAWSRRLGVVQKGEVHDWWGANDRKWHLMREELLAPDAYFEPVRDLLPGLTRHVDRAALEWIVTTRETLAGAASHPDSVHLVRYEELTRQPEQALEGISARCELARDERLLDYARRRLKPHPGSSEPVEIHEAIRPLFDQTSAQAGYEVNPR